MTVPEEFERRAARAALLAREGGAAAALLNFAGALLSAQGRVASAVASLHALAPLSGSFEKDVPRLAPLESGFLHHLAPACPGDLAGEIRGLAAEGDDAAEARLAAFWAAGGTSADFLSRAFLRPCVEAAWAVGAGPSRPSADGACPRCGGLPSLSVRRPQEGSEAGQRFLFCPLCGFEWPFGRIRCAGCLEEAPDRLPVYQSPVHPAVRVESCESCRRYLKSLDLTVDARPIPEVDDLVSVSIDLWAQEQGFTRLEPGLVGIPG